MSAGSSRCSDLTFPDTQAAAHAQVEAVKETKIEVDKKIEANLKAITEIKVATYMALRNADMTDSVIEAIAIDGSLAQLRCSIFCASTLSHPQHSVLSSEANQSLPTHVEPPPRETQSRSGTVKGGASSSLYLGFLFSLC
ncbi:hypothetical protein HN51_054227 [Arachis hypogaea]